MKKIILLQFLLCSVVLFGQKKDKVLLTIDGENILVSEFKRVYEKNLDAIDNEEAKDVEKNLELFINYKLKVKDAYRIKLDTLTSYRKEIETYKNQLSAPYLQDSAFINRLVKDAYFRLKNEVKAKHILIRFPKKATPKDTLIAFNKITNIRKRIIKGEDFEKVAEEVSEDKSARDMPENGRKGNKGNLGYFSAFKMVYPFEEAAYSTKVGEISKPFKTQYGYHILKVDSLRSSRGEVEVAHVLISDKGPKGEQLINDIYKRLQNNEQFKPLARKYSNDNASKSRGGKLRKFGSGAMIKSFEDEAFSLVKEGSYTKPFKTKYGWHIIQLIKKHPIASFKDLERELNNRVKSGSRSQLSKKAVINKLKKSYKIIEDEKAKQIFNKKDLRVTSKDSLQITILSINDRKISQEQFVDFIKNKTNKPVYQLFEDFKDEQILNYYKENLEKTEPDFANTLQEYRDGLLLFELMQQKIWEKSSKDTLGLKNYFQSNLNKYDIKDLKKIKGEVMNDYQAFLEKNWISDLRNKSAIEVNKKQFKKLIKFYNKK